MDRLTEIIHRQRKLQIRYGYDYETMTDRERVDTITMMYVAAVQELGEVLNEVTWKPWAKQEPAVAVDRVTSEIVDTLQFMLNILFAANPYLTPEGLAQLLDEKHAAKVVINDAREQSGYDGVSTKCPSCKRALDEVALTEVYIQEIGKYGTICPCGATAYVSPNPA